MARIISRIAPSEGEFKVPIYLGHGKADEIVTAEANEAVRRWLQQANPKLLGKLQLHTPEGMQHNYSTGTQK